MRNLRNKYERKKQTVEAFKSQNNLLNRLMREKKSGKIPGIFGRLVWLLVFHLLGICFAFLLAFIGFVQDGC